MLLLLPGVAPAAPAPDVAWPPGWAVERMANGDRARPPGGARTVTIDLLTRPEPPKDALAATLAGYARSGTSSGYDTGCGDPAPVALGAGTGTGAGCAVTLNNLPVVKSSFVAWAVAGGSAVLVFTAPPGQFEAQLPAFRAVVASVRTP